MKSRSLMLFTAMVLFAALAIPMQTTAQTTTTTSNSKVPAWATTAAKVGSADDNQRVSIAVFLRFRNESALKELIADVSSPSSVRYGQYLSPAQFHAQFSPPAADVQRVQRTLQNLGFRIDHTPTSGLFVQASGTVAQVKAAFGVTQDLYSYNGRVLRANAETPRIPAAIADVVSVVAGLDESAVLRTPQHIRLDGEVATAAKLTAAASASPNAPPPVQTSIPSPVCSTYWNDHSGTLSTAAAPYPATLPWLICGYTPQQLRAAYGANTVPQDGKGVTVGIVDLYGSPTILDDANRYSANHGLPHLTSKNFTQILPAGIYNVPASDPCGPQGWYEEESLDVEAVHSMAPGANIVFAGDVCSDPANAPLYSLIDEHTADIVTNSYSYNGDFFLPSWFITVENFYFEQAAAEGMSILFSTGDSGDLAAINGIASGSWDATSPWVTAVGGTSLAVLNKKGEKEEWGWGTYRVFMANATVPANGEQITTTGPELPFTFYSGSGGGPSLIELAPSYQVDVPYSLSGYTYLADGTLVPLGAAYRVDPDVAMVGDPYTGFLYGETFTIANPPTLDPGCVRLSKTTEYCEGDIGGTSLSSPLFAGVLALVNQARFQHGKASVGFVNPALYAFVDAFGYYPGSPIVDVMPPTSPTAVLRGYITNPHELRVVTINSTLDGGTLIEGADTSLQTTPGYDNVTGLGTPWVPALIDLFVLIY
ncbi:MAG: S53 family peptidase [Candidatus Acidiferrales bacterium]